jgi:hypothetical protein
MEIRRSTMHGLERTLAPTLLAALVNFGCTSGQPEAKVCTLVGCMDGFNATVVNGPGGFLVGTHEIDVTADGAIVSCTFTFPLPKLSNGADSSPQCPPGLMVYVGPATKCTQSQPTTGVVMETCEPIAGQTKELISIPGTPAQVRVRQTVDGLVVLDETVMAVYEINQPNGPRCDPTCHQAGADWTLTTVAVQDGGSE